jgi:glycosyltransferase involved in cell wall biosynthesis
MKVLHVIEYYWPAAEWGGPVTSVKLLTEAIARSGLDVSVLTTTARGHPGLPPITQGTRAVGPVSVTYCRSLGRQRFLWSPNLARAIAEQARNYDVVHLHFVWGFATLAASLACVLKRVPYVVSPRGTLDPWALTQKRSKKELFLRLIGSRILANAARIHYTTEGEREVAPQRFRSFPSAVIPNPVDVARFIDIPISVAGNGRIELLMLGRIHRQKGFDIALPAVRRLVEGGVPVRLTIAGPDERGYRAEVEKLAGSLGLSSSVEFLGTVGRDGLPEVLASRDILLMPSYEESFGMAAAEAMVAGRPVVVSDRVNIAPDVERAGAGLVVPLDSAALADAVSRLAASRGVREQMGALGREFARQHYAPNAVAHEMSQLYRSVLEEHELRGRARWTGREADL